MNFREFTPKLLTLLRTGISREQLFKDLVAGLIVGIVALPLAIAFAIASGVSPEKGLITAVVAGFVISAFGGSRVQIGGPTGAFIIIVYGIVQQYGVGGLTIATFMAGFLIIAMGLARFGNLLKYIPYPLIVGFTSGIALIIFSSQIKDFFGLPLGPLPTGFIAQWKVYATTIMQINWYAAAIALGTVLIAFNFHRISKKIPGSIVAILLSTLAVYLLDLPVETIETKFGAIPSQLPAPAIPDINLDTIKNLIQPALAIALLGAIESLLSAVVADGMTGGRHRSNMELVAQGGANILSALFGGIPATGAIARTATNIKNGGRTPVAGIVHALVLLLIMLLFAPLAKLIPLACLAGILVVVAYHMGEWHHLFALLKGNKMDTLVLLSTFLLTVIFDLVIAIEVGIVLSSFLFMKRMGDMMEVQGAGTIEEKGVREDLLFEDELNNIPKEIALYRINGPLFFGAAQKFQETLKDLRVLPKVIILRMRDVPFIDATGLHRLTETVRYFDSKGIKVILSGVNKQVREELEKSELNSLLGPGQVQDNISGSLETARKMLTA